MAAVAPNCAAAIGETTSPDGRSVPADNSLLPCWVDVTPYPFGSDGEAVNTSTSRCAPSAPADQLACYLTVTSMAFRAWNRGLAATQPANAASGATTAFGVWKFNGTSWSPDPGFPGGSTCRGDTIAWAGELDYWLVGLGNYNWPSICRFDGVNFVWEPLSLPRATVARVTPDPTRPPAPGGITSAACFAWDNCWFFGTYGARVRWDGTALKDVSPDLTAEPWLGGAATAAYAGRDAAGAAFGVAASATSVTTQNDGPLPAQPDGSPAPVLFGSRGGAFSPLAFAPPTAPRPDDPSRTDVVAVAFNPEGQGWVAGNPAGFRANFASVDAAPNERAQPTQPEPAPIVPLSPGGSDTPGCAGPAPTRFTYTRVPSPSPAFLWSSLGVFPGSGTAVAGGRVRPPAAGDGPNEDGSPEPVLARIDCDGTTTTLSFRVPDPTSQGHTTPADRWGFVTSVAVTTANDGWASTSRGVLGTGQELFAQRPHLYRLTDRATPTATPGNDDEQRPLNLKEDPPIVIEVPEEPPAPAPVAPTTVTTKAETVRLMPSVYAVRAKVHGTTLVLTFKVRRTVRLGAEALRRGKVVSRARVKRFVKPRGTLRLRLNRKRWPTKIRFVTPKADASRAAAPSDVGVEGTR